jgi:hypothetical protein
MTRAIETLISAWVAEQERERVRRRAEPDAAAAARVEPEWDAALRGRSATPDEPHARE